MQQGWPPQAAAAERRSLPALCPLRTAPPTQPPTPTPILSSHLRDLLLDEERTDALVREHNGIYADFSRQNMTQARAR